MKRHRKVDPYDPKRIRRKDRINPCCNSPAHEYHSSWQDETGLCAHCGKRLRFGNGPLSGGWWPKGSIRGNKSGIPKNSR